MAQQGQWWLGSGLLLALIMPVAAEMLLMLQSIESQTFNTIPPAIWIDLIIIPALTEEVMFHGVLFRQLSQR